MEYCYDVTCNSPCYFSKLRIKLSILYWTFYSLCNSWCHQVQRGRNLPRCQVVFPSASDWHPLPGTWRHPWWVDNQCIDIDCHPRHPPPGSSSGTLRTSVAYKQRHTIVLIYTAIHFVRTIWKKMTFFPFTTEVWKSPSSFCTSASWKLKLI